MHFEWDFRGKTYWLFIGFSGTRKAAWGWRFGEEYVTPSTIYRLQPFSLTIFDRLIP